MTPPLKLFPVRLLTVQPTPFCNLDCSYCYLPGRDSKRRFDLDLIPALFENLKQSRLLDDTLHWCWHAGEPLVAGLPFFREASERIRAAAPDSLRVRLSVQTNGTLLTPEFADLFARFRYGVGVSLDGPAFLHDRHRVSRTGRGSFDAVSRGIRHLQDRGVPFQILCVLTEASLDHAEAIYESFRSLGPKGVAFNVEEIEGIHRHSSLQGAAIRRRVRRFFHSLFSIHRDRGASFALREWDKCRDTYSPDDPVIPGTTVPFDHLTVTWNGDYATFAPELATLPASERYGSFILGNLRNDLVRDAIHRPEFRVMHNDIRHGVTACRQSCPQFAACGGGHVSNKLHEHGTFASSETMTCRLIEKDVRRVAHRLLHPRATRSTAGRIRRAPL